MLKQRGGHAKKCTIKRCCKCYLIIHLSNVCVTQQRFISQEKVKSCHETFNNQARFQSNLGQIYFSLILNCNPKLKCYIYTLIFFFFFFFFSRERKENFLISTVAGVNVTTTQHGFGPVPINQMS